MPQSLIPPSSLAFRSRVSIHRKMTRVKNRWLRRSDAQLGGLIALWHINRGSSAPARVWAREGVVRFSRIGYGRRQRIGDEAGRHFPDLVTTAAPRSTRWLPRNVFLWMPIGRQEAASRSQTAPPQTINHGIKEQFSLFSASRHDWSVY